MIWDLVLLGIAMGANNAMASIGLGTSRMSRGHQFQTAFVFAIFEAMMPIVGIFVGENVASVIGAKTKLLGSLIILLAGLYALFKKKAPEVERDPNLHRKTGISNVIFLAIALSLDNLSVGFGLGMFHVSLTMAMLVFGTVSLIMTWLGLELGRYIGSRIKVSADQLSGVVLVAVAVFMAFS